MTLSLCVFLGSKTRTKEKSKMLKVELIRDFYDGISTDSYKLFGAHFENYDGEDGVRFTVFAPNAVNVQVVGDFNNWDGSDHYMEKYDDGGIYTLFVEGLNEYETYKYRIETHSHATVDRADPYAFFSEVRPNTASKVFDMEHFSWTDQNWMGSRELNFQKPLNIYEVNIGSWRMIKEFSSPEEDDGAFYNYEKMADMLIPYVKEQGYTHIELMPITEFPYDGSWGYQTTGYFAATSRYGNPRQLMHFIDKAHQEGIGVIVDVVPAHYVKDGHGLYMFDGGMVYENDDMWRRYSSWGSVYFDYSKNHVRSFMLSSINFFAKYYHLDGFRFDAVANLIYYDGDRNNGEMGWSIHFIKQMTATMHDLHPNVMLIAEDSTDYPQVTKHPSVGGLGFDYKWDLGWMNDTLKYMKMDPLFRANPENHNLITFSMHYFYNENFLLPFSHDEVVHSKGTILDKCWGNLEQKIAQVKTLYTYMMMHPGKKLNFMGNELAEFKEWDEKKEVGWSILQYPLHDSVFRYLKGLNHIYKNYSCLFVGDYDWSTFEWLIVDDNLQSVFGFRRRAKVAGDKDLIVIINFGTNMHQYYSVPMSDKGVAKEIINSDQDTFGGNNQVNPEPIATTAQPDESGKYHLPVLIAPFSSMIFEFEAEKK